MEDLDLDFEEDLVVARVSSDRENKFDEAIGHIEDIIMDDAFQDLQQGFLEKYYKEFEESEENKLIYTDIHNEYVQVIETYLHNELCSRITNFSMEEFQRHLQMERGRLEGEVFDMLLTFTDFLAFKEMVLDFKADKEGTSIDFSPGMVVRSLSRKENEEDVAQASASASVQPNIVSLDFSPVSQLPQVDSQQIHNLQVGGHSFLVSTPFGDGPSFPSPNGELSHEMQGSAAACTSSAASRVTDCSQDELEAMNISPRPTADMEMSPRDMDM